MSATNLDLPVLISPEQIRRREFVTTRRGYDPDQVRDYLGQLADQIQQLRSMLTEARSEAQAAARTNVQPRPDPYQLLGARVANVIRAADEAAETIRHDANQDAERMTHEARTDVDRIRTDAQARAEAARAQADGAVRAAREEADRTLAGLSTRRDALVDQLASMQERLLGIARDLEAAIDLKSPLAELPAMPLSSPTQPGEPIEVGTRNGSSGSAGEGPILLPEPTDPAQPILPLVRAEEEQDEPSFIDPSYEELWEGTAAMRFEIPDIPPLDLDWGEDDDPTG